MQLIERKDLSFELRPENLEDLWILSQILSPNDLVSATTERKVKVGSENNPKQVKKLIRVDLKVNKITFEHEILRVSGEIQNETEFTAVGASHTLSFSIHDPISFSKQELFEYQNKLLTQALDSKKSLNLLVLFDKDELITAEFGQFSYKILFEEQGLGSKKYEGQAINDNEQKYQLLKPFLEREYAHIIFSGPGMFKDGLAKYVKDKGISVKTHTWQEVSSSAVQKAINDINRLQLVENSQLALEGKYSQELLKNINTGSKAAYGVEETLAAVNEGKVGVLLLTSKFIDDKREGGEYDAINEAMRIVEQMKGELVLIQSDNEPGKIIDGLGGIAAILRY